MTDVQATPATSDDMFVAVVLDESGSMDSCKPATISGFNEYVKTLQDSYAKDPKGKILLTLAKFSGSIGVKIVHEGLKIEDVPMLTDATFRPGGGTPLLDAVGSVIKSMESLVTKEALPPKVAIVIITDGGENASREYKTDAIKQLITDRQKSGWVFNFLGADQDAWDVGMNMGFAAANTASYASKNTKMMYAAVAESALRGRAARGIADYVTASAFTPDEVTQMVDGDDDLMKTRVYRNAAPVNP